MVHAVMLTPLLLDWSILYDYIQVVHAEMYATRLISMLLCKSLMQIVATQIGAV